MKKSMILALSAASCLLLSAAELQVGTARDLKIDGKLDEPAWAAAETGTNFSSLFSLGGKTVTPNTKIKYLADKENLYVGIHCDEPNMKNLRATMQGKNNPSPWRDDSVELFFLPSVIQDTYYQFVITAGGGSWQQYYAEGGNIKPDSYFSPDYTVKIHRGENFWSAEMQIPFSAFYTTPAKNWRRQWTANVTRNRLAGGKFEMSTWSKQMNSFHEFGRYNTLKNLPPKGTDSDFTINSAVFEPKSQDSHQRTSGTVWVDLAAPTGGTFTLTGESKNLIRAFSQKIQLKPGKNRLAFADNLFAKNQRTNLQLTLTNPKGKILSRRICQVRVAYSPLEIHLTSPGYANNFYPGQDASRVKGWIDVRLQAEQIKLTCGKKIHLLPVKNGKAEFDLDISVMKGEDFTLTAETMGKQCSVKIRHIRKSGGLMGWIENGSLIVNGEPVFFLSFYDMGFGPLGGWKLSRAWLEKNPYPPFPHHNYPRKTMDPNSFIRGIEGKEGIYDVKPSQELLDKIAKRIDPESKEFLFYYLNDEPDCRGVSPVWLRHIYEFIKERDPYHLVMIIDRNPEKYVDCCDVINPHFYIGPSVVDGKRFLSRPVASSRDHLRRIQRPDKLLMITPQTYSTAHCNLYGTYPNFDETRATLWSSVCENCVGFTPYIYYGHASDPEMRLTIPFIYNSADRLKDFLRHPTNSEKISNSNPLISAKLFRNDGKYLMVLANACPDRLNTTIEAATLGNRKLYRFREDGCVQFSGGKAVFDLAPYQVMLLTSEPMDKGMSSLTQVRKDIADALAAASSRGNILYHRGREIEISRSPGRYYDNMMQDQETFFDGILDMIGYQPYKVGSSTPTPLWIEMAFPKFVPRFSKAKIHGHALRGMTFKIWKYGKWITPECSRKESKYLTELDFGKTLSTVKIRLEFVPVKGNKPNVEMYEFELFE